MKKLLLSFLIAAPFIGHAQVSNPEVQPTFTPTPHTGWTATVDHFDAYGGGITTGDQLIDGDPNTYWETFNDPNLTHWAVINMGVSQNVDSIYILLRSGQNSAGGNDAHKMAIFTSIDSITWTQQGDTIDYVGKTAPLRTLFVFPATVNCKFLKLVSYEQQTVNIAEIGLYTIVDNVPDPNAYNRTGWKITGDQLTSNEQGTTPVNSEDATKAIDNDGSTFWQTNWSGTIPHFPHVLTVDMGVIQDVNQIIYGQRSNNINSQAAEATICFSKDTLADGWGPQIPLSFVHDQLDGLRRKVDLPSTQNARYFKLTITANAYVLANPTTDTVAKESTYFPTSLAELGTGYDQSLTTPVGLQPLVASATGAVVKLSWSTASENNSDHFAVTRSADGINFSTIGTVAAAGQSTTARNYSFTDAAPLAGINYYQLVALDKDGSSSKSNVAQVSVGNTNAAGITIKGVSANSVKLAINNAVAGQGTISIYNAAGQRAATKSVTLNAGSTQAAVTVNGATGVYFVVVTTGSQKLTAKFFKP